jgi:hypothetical protein
VLEASSRVLIDANGEDLTYTLTINNVTKEDAGRYQLKASNALGRQQCSLTVEVGGYTGDLVTPSAALEETTFRIKVDPTIPAGAVPALPSVGFAPKPSAPAARRSEASRVKQDVKSKPISTEAPTESIQPVHSSTPLKTSEDRTNTSEPTAPVSEEPQKYESSEKSSKESTPISEKSPETMQDPVPELEVEAEQVESEPASECESAASDNEEALEREEEPISAAKSTIRVIQPLEDIETDIDEYIMLQCEFDSEGEVSWTLDDGALPSSTVVRQVGPLAKIRIRQVTSNDFGEYMATVQDARGTASTKCVLSKKGSRKPSARQTESVPDVKSEDENNEEEIGSAPRISELSNMTIKEGDDLQLELNVDSPSGYEVSWLYNDQVFQADDENMTVIDKFPELTRLILKDVIEEDSGDYVVKVTNEFGSSVSQCRVDVILLADPPKFLSAPDEVDCQFGSLVQINFAVENATQATLIVTDEQKIPASINSDGVGQVAFEAAEDSPDYAVLLLVGAGGETEHKVVFNLSAALKAPSFTERLHETRAEEGDSVLLEVAASGNPEPQFAWFKGDENLNISGPQLQLENISLEDAGRYSVQV